MRLELKQVQGDNIGTKWFFERGKRTLGRSPDCDWPLPDPQRRVSKIHCTIERDRDGFLLRDQSANGSRVEDVIVLEGDTARLADGCHIEFAGLAFVVGITGEPDRDIDDPDATLGLSDETLTISSILADIAPGGRTANGVLGERVGEDWLGSVDSRPKLDGKTSSIRDVDIGWDGPPDADGIKARLPDDWNADFDYGSQLEHASAMRVSVPAARSRSMADGEDTARTIVAANDVVITDRNPRSAAATDFLPNVQGLVDELEAAFAYSLSIFDLNNMETRPSAPNPDQEAELVERLAALLARQVRFNGQLEALVREASHRLEPRLIEARADAAARKLCWPGKRGYWRAYHEQFERDGKNLSIVDLFREAMLGAEGDTEDTDASSIPERKNNSR